MASLDFLKGRASAAKVAIDTMLGNVLPSIKLEDTNMCGKRVLVTGANTGIGKDFAKWMAAHGAEVILMCRNASKAEDARKEIYEETKNEAVSTEIIDMSSLSSVNAFIDRWDARAPDQRGIDILYNNAGAGINAKMTTPDGLELSYATNFLTSFFLTTTLLQHGRFTSDARIIQCSSISRFDSNPLDPNDPNSNDLLSGLTEGEQIPFENFTLLYGRAKASQVIFTKELQEKLLESTKWKGIVVQSCHPGAVKTGMWDREDGMAGYGKASEGVRKTLGAVSVSAAEGAATPLFLATSPEAAKAENRGGFAFRTTWRWTPAWMDEESRRKALWTRWEKDAGVVAQNF